MKDQSPFEAVTSWLKREFNIEPNNLQVMMLIDEVRQALPPKGDNTIAALRAILRSLEPHDGLDAWCSRMSEEIVGGLAKIPQVKELARAVDNETFWCHLEGTLAGMLKRVTRGQDLEVPPEEPMDLRLHKFLPISDDEINWLRRKVGQDMDPARGYSLERGGEYVNAVAMLLDKVADLQGVLVRTYAVSHGDIPDPSTDEALKQGCLCPAIDNCYGKGYRNQPGIFIKEDKCPLHGKKGPKGS